MRNLTIGLAALVALVPAIASADVAQPKKLLAMSPDAFSSKVAVQEDKLEHITVLSTEGAFKGSSKSQVRAIINDNHVRAIVDKRTGATRYEVHQNLRYAGARRDYVAVNYATPQGLVQKKLTRAQHGLDYCPNSDTNGDCAFSKHIAFEVDEGVLRDIAGNYRPGSSESWTFKLKDNTGHDFRDGIVPAEVAGLLKAVDTYRAQRSSTATVTTAPTAG